MTPKPKMESKTVRMEARGVAAVAASLLALLLSTSPTAATAGASDNYAAGGTAVAQSSGLPEVDGRFFLDAETFGSGEGGEGGGVFGVAAKGGADSGVAICNKSSAAPSVGGGCVPFGQGDSVRVFDDVQQTRVAFQVCIDNNGDGICTFQPGAGGCADDLYFSHSAEGAFYNPLGPLPAGFRDGCPGGAGRATWSCCAKASTPRTPHTPTR